MEFISERVSTESKPDSFSVVISSRLPKAQMALLIGWLAAWTFCGVYFMLALSQGQNAETRLALFIMLAFWAYFELRILNVVLWRVKGFELWLLEREELTVKNSLFGYGKASRYFVANMTRFGLLNVEEDTWKWQLSDSFWTRGAERLGFEYQGRKMAIGRGVTKEEAQGLAHLMSKELKKARAALQK